jgi:exodeoxyribonuclease VII large subunit
MRAPTPSAAAELAFFDANELLMRVDSLYKRASMVIDRNVRMLDGRIDALSKDVQMLSPEKVTDDKILRVQRMRERLDAMGGSRVESACGELRTLCARLEGINPLAVLSRGYSMVQTQGGEIASKLLDIEEGETLTVRMSDGDFSAKVIQKND